MKSIFILFFCLLSVQSGFAQFTRPGLSKYHIENLQHLPLKVLLTGDEIFDSSLVEAVRSYWKVSAFEFVSDDKKLPVVSDIKNSYLLMFISSKRKDPGAVLGNKDQWAMSQFLVLSNWLKPDNGMFSQDHSASDFYRNDIAIAPIDIWNYESNLEHVDYRIGFMVKGLNDVASILMNGEIKLKAEIVFTAIPEFINNKRAGTIGKKTLLIAREYLKEPSVMPRSETSIPKGDFYRNWLPEEVMTKSYPYPFEILPQGKIKELIQEKDSTHCLLVFIYSEGTYTLVYDLETGETLYENKQMISVSDRSVDNKYINELVKAIKDASK